MRFLVALCATAAVAVKLNEPENFLQMKATVKRASMPRDTGFSHPWDHDSMENEDGEMDIQAVEDNSNEVDPNHYKGEDEHREQINEQVTHFRRESKRPVIIRNRENRRMSNDDLW